MSLTRDQWLRIAQLLNRIEQRLDGATHRPLRRVTRQDILGFTEEIRQLVEQVIGQVDRPIRRP